MQKLINVAAILVVSVSIFGIGFVGLFLVKNHDVQFGIMTLIIIPIVVLLFFIKKPKNTPTTITSAQIMNSTLRSDANSQCLWIKDLERGPPPSYSQLFSIKQTPPSYEEAVKNEEIFIISGIAIKCGKLML